MILTVKCINIQERACGLDLPDYPYIYFPILLPDKYNYTVCVRECPVFEGTNWPDNISCANNSAVPSCNRNCFDYDFSNASTLKNFPPKSINTS